MKKSIRIICIRPRLWKSALCCCAIFFFCLIGKNSNPENVITVSGTSRQLPIYSVSQEEKIMSISFDAAWGNEDTEQLIGILDQFQVSATFFVVGEWVDKFPESVLALHQAGHEVMNHSDTHAHFPKLSAEEIVADISACNDKIEAITGVRPTLIRLPYGDYNDLVITTIRAMGMEPIQWDVDSHDWMEVTANEISSRVIELSAEGSIVLFHNAAINTPAALPLILSTLQGKGFSFQKISELLLDSDYSIDHNGKQIPVKMQEY